MLDHFMKDLLMRGLYLSLTFLVGYIGLTIAFRFKRKFELKTIIRKKQQDREEVFLKLENKYEYSRDHEKILKLDEQELIRQLQTRRLKAKEVLDAYIAKAIYINRELNCITEFIDDAEDWAKKLDKMTEIKGPFHGLPVSIKDNCNVEGMDSTLGLGKRLWKPAEDHAVLVKVLLDLGAVPYCKTNVPQTLMSFDCTNPIFGTTKNFLNSELSPGGSSGGESTLIAAGGSVFGLGSDIGGSVRIPAHFSGICGLKVTKDRLSPRGYVASIPNAVGIVGVPGLMARTSKTLTYAFQNIVDERRQQKYDPLVLPLGFDEKLFTSPASLRVGYFTSLPFFPLLGDTEETVIKAKKALEEMGHTLIPFKPPDSFYIFELISEFSLCDNGANFVKNWKSEPIPKGLMTNYLVCSAPKWVRRFIATMIDVILPYIHSPRAATILRHGALDSGSLLKCLGERKKMIENVLSQWKRLNLDILICPTFPYPAIPHDAPARQQGACVYTMMWNLFDFPSGTVPFGHESGEKIESYDTHGDFMLRAAKKYTKESIGMPISVQVVGLPYEEEKVLRGMELLESLTEYDAKYWYENRVSKYVIEDYDCDDY